MKRILICLILLIYSCLLAPAEEPSIEADQHELGLPVASPLAVIPTSANLAGRHGAFFKTRVVIHNLSDESYDIQAILCGSRGIVDRRTINMTPRYYRWYDNFLEQVFGYTGAGAIILVAGDLASLDNLDVENSTEKFSVTVEVYSDSPNGRYSTPVVNGIIPLVDLGTVAWNTGISVNSRQRVNIGVFNSGADTSTITAYVYDTSGTVVQTVRFTAEALSTPLHKY